MIFQKIAVLLALIPILMLSGCKKEPDVPPPPPPDPNFPVSVETEQETITLGKAPDTLVSVSPAMTEVLLDLGARASLKGVSSYDRISGLADCGTAQHVDLEAVRSIRPQLLFTDTPLLSHQLTELYQMDVQVVLFRRPQDLQQVLTRMEDTASLLYGKKDGPEKAAPSMKEWQDAWAILEKAGSLVTQRKTAMLIGGLQIAATGDTFEGQLLNMLGFENLAQDGENWTIQPPEKPEGEEQTETSLWNPQVLFYDSRMDEETIRTSEEYGQSEAVLNGALYPVDWDVLQMMTLEFPQMCGDILKEFYPEQWEQAQPAPEPEPVPEEEAPEAPAEPE